MRTNKIRELIQAAVANEDASHNLSEALRGLARIRGVSLSPPQLAPIEQFVQQYVEHAPAYLDAIAAVAEQAGLIREWQPILSAAEDYFLEPNDLIPDQLGLLGFVDDAYVTHSILQGLSESYRQKTGTALLPLEMNQANAVMRGLIGEPHAGILDNWVRNALHQPTIQDAINAIIAAGFQYPINSPDPIWGNASPSEIANARLGAMGVV